MNEDTLEPGQVTAAELPENTPKTVRIPAKTRLPSYQDLLDENALTQGERVFCSQRKVAAAYFLLLLSGSWEGVQHYPD